MFLFFSKKRSWFSFFFFFSSRRRHTRFDCDWSSDVCSSDLDDVDAHALPFDAGAFGEDGNAALALEIAGVERPLGDLLVFAHSARLPEQLVDQRRLAVIDMGDNGDVADVHDAFGPARRCGLIRNAR